MRTLRRTIAGSLLLPCVLAACYDPSPAFPIPLWTDGQDALQPAFESITSKLAELAGDSKYDTLSFSVELTSNTETLWSTYHSARQHNDSRPGIKHVDGDSQYRIASITKTFPVLAILHLQKASELDLDDTVA